MAKIDKLTIGKLLFWAFLLRLFFLFISSYHPDILNHVDWGNRFLALGSKKFYENIFWSVSWPNQPLGSMLLFALMALIKNSLFSFLLLLNNTFSFFPSFIIPVLEKNLHVWLVKLPFILSDLGIGFLIYKIVNQFRPKKALLAASLFLFNPVLIYNSTIWGQTDSLINLLAILGIYLTFQKKYFPGIVIFLFGFLFKLSLIIYIPIFGLLLLKRIKDWKKFILPIISFVVFLFIIAIPFKLDGFGSFQWLWYMYINRVLPRQGSMLNGNAFNFWALIFSINLSNSEFTRILGFTYQFWGRFLYIIFLIPVWFKFIKSKLSLKSLLTALTLSSFLSFIFLTNMHERYLYPIFPLISVLIFIPKSKFNLKQLVLLSIIHFLNLYKLWYYPLINPLRFFLDFGNSLVCRLFSLILITICFNYFVKYLKSED